MHSIMRPFVWLMRLRQSLGFGVQSPYAFWFLLQVLHQETPYYSYQVLAKKEKEDRFNHDKDWLYEPRFQRRLLFRLVNEANPQNIVDFGRISASSLYMQAARTSANYLAAHDVSELFLEQDEPIDFLYLHDNRHPSQLRQALDVCIQRIHEKSMFVIEGIGYDKELRKIWKEIITDSRVSLTFDAYNVGIIFFDPSLNHKHYTVAL